MKDATSLPWPAVRGAWATSKHDLEEGHLGWQDATQWSINRLSSSQISMASSQVPQMSQPRKLCKFFNEGSCSHEANHRITDMCVHIVKDRGRLGTTQKASASQNEGPRTDNQIFRTGSHLDNHHTSETVTRMLDMGGKTLSVNGKNPNIYNVNGF